MLGNDEPPSKIEENIRSVLRVFAPHLLAVPLPKPTLAHEVRSSPHCAC
jgi:hypothetical protein